MPFDVAASRLALPTLIAVLAFSLRPVNAESGLTLPELLDRVETAERSTRSLSFSFIQKRLGSVNPKSSDIQGKAQFKRPRRIRIDQSRPEHQTIVRRDDELLIYTPRAEQILKGSWANWVRSAGVPYVLFSFLGDFPASDWTQRYTLIFGGQDGGNYHLTLKPKASGEPVVDLWISDDTFLMNRGRLTSRDGIVDIYVTEMKQNIDVPESRFTLKVASGTAVIPLPS